MGAKRPHKFPRFHAQYEQAFPGSLCGDDTNKTAREGAYDGGKCAGLPDKSLEVLN